MGAPGRGSTMVARSGRSSARSAQHWGVAICRPCGDGRAAWCRAMAWGPPWPLAADGDDRRWLGVGWLTQCLAPAPLPRRRRGAACACLPQAAWRRRACRASGRSPAARASRSCPTCRGECASAGPTHSRHRYTPASHDWVQYAVPSLSRPAPVGADVAPQRQCGDGLAVAHGREPSLACLFALSFPWRRRKDEGVSSRGFAFNPVRARGCEGVCVCVQGLAVCCGVARLGSRCTQPAAGDGGLCRFLCLGWCCCPSRPALWLVPSLSGHSCPCCGSLSWHLGL